MARRDTRPRRIVSGWFWPLACAALLATAAPAALTTNATLSARPDTPGRTDILWDTWGVPHIFAPDEAGLFRAFGWAQMENHADLLLRLYGQARGRAAEYWGPAYVASDTTARTFDFAGQTHAWYAHQSPAFRRDLDAFAAGINAYAQAHRAQIAPNERVVLPVSPYDVLAHTQRVLYTFIALNSSCARATPLGLKLGAAGSNGWAVGPTHAAGNRAMLLANPHLPWSDLFTVMEAQLTGPTISAYGAALVGLPVLSIAFNDDLGWTHTVSTLVSCTLYKLTLAGRGYRFDGRVRPFTVRTSTLVIRQPDGTLRHQTLVLRRAIQGPVVALHGQTLAVRTVAVDQFPAYGVLQEWWDMARAHSLAQFQQALARLQIPAFMVLYADRQGHIMSLYNGQAPERPQGDYAAWLGTVPGDTSATLWSTLTPYRDLPRVIDPPTGWVENANSPPWFTTYPAVLNPNTYPASLAPQYLTFREQRAISLLMGQPRLTLAQMIADKLSSRMELADRVVPALVAAARRYGTPLARQAADVLVHWDHTADATSRGALLFFAWIQQQQGAIDAGDTGPGLFATRWQASQPLTTPRDLASPQTAAATLDGAARMLRGQGLALDTAWGQMVRLRRGRVDLPASGTYEDPYGSLRSLEFAPDKDGRYRSIGGDSFIAAVRFSTPVQARVLLTYGNASQPGSPHDGDQLRLYARNQLRTAWLTRAEVQAHLDMEEAIR